jgi:predicted amidohydrolase
MNAPIVAALLGALVIFAGGCSASSNPFSSLSGAKGASLGRFVKVAALQYGPSRAHAARVDESCATVADENNCAVIKLAEKAAAARAEVVVAPELVLDQQVDEPEPNVGDLPADNAQLSEQSLLKIFSKLAKRLRVLLVVHFQTQHPTSKDKHSSQIVYDESGAVVGVHHKFELYGGENDVLARGQDHTVIDTVLGKAAPLICADLYGDPRHHAKLTKELGAGVIFVSSYWTVRSGARWQAAFAKNWGVYVIGANTTGGAGQGGGIYGPQGQPLAESLADEPKVLLAEIPTPGE